MKAETKTNERLRFRSPLPGRIGALWAAAGSLAAAPPWVLAQTGTDRLEEVVVTGSLIETPRRQLGTAVSTIDGDDIELRGYNSIADVLRTQPGIGVSNSGGIGKSTTLRIRGEEGYRTLLMIDGVKAIDPTGTQQGPSFDSLLTTSDLQRVEILRGPQGFVYGADAGGVVNVLTRTGAGDPGGRIGIEGGKFGTVRYDASLAGGSDLGDYFVSVSDLGSDGFNAQSADTVLVDDDGADNTTLHAKLGWNATENLRLQLVARDIDAETRYDGCFDPETFSTLHACVSSSEQTTYRLSAVLDGEIFAHSFGYSEIDIARADFADGAPSFSNDGQLGRLEYTGTFQPSESTTLIYGADLQTEKVTGDSDQARDQDGYYIEYQGAFDDRFFVSAGARYDDNDDFGTHTSARVGAAYLQDLGGGRSLKYRTSLGTGFRAPSLFEIAYNERPFGVFPAAAGTALKEENSQGYDLGIEYDTQNGLHVEVTYFDHEIEDQIDYVFDPDTFEDGYMQTMGAGTSSGYEIIAQLPLGERIELLANWTSNDTETTSGTQRLRRPETLANIGVLYRSADDRFRFVANYRLSRDSIDFGTIPLDDYEVLDLSVSYSFNERFDVYGRIENATGEDYVEVIGFNTADRAGYAGVRFRF